MFGRIHQWSPLDLELSFVKIFDSMSKYVDGRSVCWSNPLLLFLRISVKFAGVVFRVSFFALLMSVDSSLDVENLCLFFSLLSLSRGFREPPLGFIDFSLVFFYFLSSISTPHFLLLTWVSFSLLSLVSCGSWDQWMRPSFSLLWVFSAINPPKLQHPTDVGMLCFHSHAIQNPSCFLFHFLFLPRVGFLGNVLLSF